MSHRAACRDQRRLNVCSRLILNWYSRKIFCILPTAIRPSICSPSLQYIHVFGTRLTFNLDSLFSLAQRKKLLTFTLKIVFIRSSVEVNVQLLLQLLHRSDVVTKQFHTSVSYLYFCDLSVDTKDNLSEYLKLPVSLFLSNHRQLKVTQSEHWNKPDLESTF